MDPAADLELEVLEGWFGLPFDIVCCDVLAAGSCTAAFASANLRV